MNSLDVLVIFIAVSFVYYGLACLFSRYMAQEFQRYGVPKFRPLIGSLEVLGAVGLIAGYVVPYLQILSAGGLALLMLSGCLLRIKIKDAWTQILPAFFFFVLNGFVVIMLLGRD
jgi:hypothetical protein